MARSMWKGSLAFGPVNIPVELYSATRDYRPKFRMLHAKDEAPVKWHPEKCTDEYKENLLRVVNAKLKGKKPKLIDEDTSPKQAGVVDLMARLRASLEGGKAAGPSRAGSRGSPRKAAASKGKKPARTRRRVA